MEHNDDWPDDGAEIRAQVEALQVKLRAHPGFLARAKWDLLKRAYSIWVSNSNELHAILSAVETSEELKVELIQNVRAPTVRLAFFAELDQRLHNMVASAVSLVDHTRVLRKHYPSTEFADMFEKENRKVADAPESAFIRKLRNYLLHNGHAPFTSSATLPVPGGPSNTIDMKLRLSSSALLAAYDWDLASRTFIENQPEDIDLMAVVTTYSSAMQALYGWTFDQYEVLHHADVDEMNALIKEINLTMTGGAHDGRNMEAFWNHVAENNERAKRGEAQLDWQDVKNADE